MLKKTTRWFFNGVSLAVHVAVVCMLFAIPIYFFVQIGNSPRFTINDMRAETAADDPFLAEAGLEGGDWYRLTYDCSADVGPYSPFSYTIETFTLRAPYGFLSEHETCLVLDEPLAFSVKEPDDFTLTLYVRASAAAEAEEIMRSVGFTARRTERTFSFFTKKIDVNPPYFYADGLTSH